MEKTFAVLRKQQGIEVKHEMNEYVINIFLILNNIWK